MPHRRAMRCLWRAMNRENEETQPDRPLWSRRDLLKAAGMALGAAIFSGGAFDALPRGRSYARPTGTPRIGIVGAGIAGVVAALTLKDAGIPCSVYESSGRIGGRMHSNHTFWADGQTSEWCGEFIDTDHVVIRRLAKRFGLTLADVNAAEPPGSVDTNYFEGGYYPAAELEQGLKSIAPILAEQNKAIGQVVVYNRYTPAGYQFDHMSVYEWIEQYVPGGHGSRLGQYLNEAEVTENGLETAAQSALNLIFPLNSDEAYHIQNGNQQLPALIAATFPAGTVRLGWRMRAISADESGPVTLTFASAAGERTATFDYVVLALPFSVLRALDFSRAGFDPLKQRAIRELGYGTNSKLVLQFDDRYWNHRGAWPGVSDGFVQTDLPIQSAWDSSRAEPGPDGLLTNYTGGPRGASYQPDHPYTTSQSSALTARLAQQFLDQLDVVWPGVSAHYTGRATLSYPTGDPNLRGSYSAYKVGQYTEFAGYEGVPQGRIYFAGEHTSYNFQGYMEGGAQTGERAAREILKALGRSA
jgi:monoamine oxidase